MAKREDKAKKRAAAQGARPQRRGRSQGLPRRGAQLRRLLLAASVGLLLLALALLVGDADYHASAMGWMPLLMYLALVALAWGYLQVLRRGLSFAERVEASDCLRDSTIPFEVTFTNRTPLFFYSARVSFVVRDLFGEPAHRVQTSISLAPHESYTMGFDMRFEHVGSYEAGIEEVELSDFLGLFSCTLPNRSPKSVSVCPKLWSIAKMEFSEEALDDSDKLARSVLADSMDYAHVRDYVPGDPLKTIHWKLSARAGSYQTRLFEVYTNPGVAVLMDFYCPARDAEDLMGVYDAVIECAFSIAAYAGREGLETALFCEDAHGEQLRLGSWDRDAMAQFVEQVPAVSADPALEGRAPALLRGLVATGCGLNNVVLCTSNFGAQTVQAVLEAKLSGRAVQVVAVVPLSAVDRDREDYCRPLLQLEAAGVRCMVVHRPQEMPGVVAQ